MFEFHWLSRTFRIAIFSLLATGLAHGQHPWQAPPERDAAEVERIVGPIAGVEPSRDLNIVWVWGVDKNHGRGAHEYGWVMDRFVNTLLPRVPRVRAERAMYFPTDDQWARADLVVFYVQGRAAWGKKEYELIDAYQARGGGLIFLHLALLEGSGEALAKRIGLAYGTRRGGTGLTQWGALPMPVRLTDAGSKSPLFEGFPVNFDLVDEHYWNLRGDAGEVTTLMTAPGGPTNGSSRPPKSDELDGKAWPVMWTKVEGEGKEFATVLGHNYFTFNDPYFRIILLRAMAWTMNESFDAFKPLVSLHLER